jgi:hypothetical protein
MFAFIAAVKFSTCLLVLVLLIILLIWLMLIWLLLIWLLLIWLLLGVLLGLSKEISMELLHVSTDDVITLFVLFTSLFGVLICFVIVLMFAFIAAVKFSTCLFVLVLLIQFVKSCCLLASLSYGEEVVLFAGVVFVLLFLMLGAGGLGGRSSKPSSAMVDRC